VRVGSPSVSSARPGVLRRGSLTCSIVSRRQRHSANLPDVNSATVAAITAAVVSFIGVIINVFWTYRLSSQAQLEQWRRNEERPVVARMVTLSTDALEQWWQAARARREWLDSLSADPGRANKDTATRPEPRDDWAAGSELYDKLRFEAAQLDLIAGQALRDVARRLVTVHESLNHWLRPASPKDDPIRSVNEQNNKIIGLHEELVEKARADLGLGSNAQPPPYRSLMASSDQG
jgi:hypothetical protein